MFNYLIYHRSCLNGFGCAFIGWSKLGNTCNYISLDYDDPVPDIKKSNI